MAALRSDSSVQYIKGVGPRRAGLFASAGIHTIGDLLHYYPFRHEVDQGETDIEDLVPDTTATVRGEVVALGGRRGSPWAEITDGTGECRLRWFNAPYAGHGLVRGVLVMATGRVQLYRDSLELVQPRVRVFHPDATIEPEGRGARLVGVYRGNAQLKSALIRRTLHEVLAAPTLPVEDFLPAGLRARRTLPERAEAVRHMHLPPSAAGLDRARQRLAYEELLLMELAMALRRHKRLSLQSGQKLHITAEIDQRIRGRFPFTLTAAQDGAVREIAADLQSGRPMTRLLQGDVGSGKTVVALYACLVAVANGRQAAIMAPTEILAQQHYNNIAKYLRDSRVRHVLLRGGLPRAERAEALGAIERGEMDLVVGTQALIQRDVAFEGLALVVVDEQHKFGVLQRHTFRTKGPMPHYLVMTATPIPRTLAMTVFGDLDVSLMRASPPGRGRVITKVVSAGQWDKVMGYVRGRLEAGEQAYVVAPLIGAEDESDDPSVAAGEHVDGAGAPPVADEHRLSKSRRTRTSGNASACGRRQARQGVVSATELHQRLATGPWAGLRVDLLHGGLTTAEKNRVLSAFAAGETRAVVATTVVEVGVDVPNATVMVIEQAEQYGLSQLHQLRGRVGRGQRDSLCVLIARGHGPKARERLEVMMRTTDGFEIAEADLRQRGPGQFFGTRQHGLPELTMANIVEDFALLEAARQDAFELVRSDPTLARPEHQALLPPLRRMFGEKLALIDAG